MGSSVVRLGISPRRIFLMYVSILLKPRQYELGYVCRKTKGQAGDFRKRENVINKES